MIDTDWFQGKSLDERMSQCMYWQRVAVGLICLFIVAFLFFWPSNANAGPIFQATDGPAVVTLYSDECQLKAEISNLKQRATWVEKGKTFEGCWSPTPFGFVVMYFSGDKTVGVAPNDAFTRITGA